MVGVIFGFLKAQGVIWQFLSPSTDLGVAVSNLLVGVANMVRLACLLPGIYYSCKHIYII